MHTIEIIYRVRLQALANQLGGQNQLAEAIGKSPGQLGQWINASKDWRTGKPRSMSKGIAREIEAKLGHEEGWMDRPLEPHELRVLEQMMGRGTEKSVKTERGLTDRASGDANPLKLGIATVRKLASRVTTSIRSPSVVDDWTMFGRDDVSGTQYESEPFDALVAPGPFPATFELTTVPGDWMEPDIRRGDYIWIDRTASPKSENVVLALDTKTGRSFLGEYQEGYGGGFYVKPRKGVMADSSVHPVSIMAVVMCHLRMCVAA